MPGVPGGGFRAHPGGGDVDDPDLDRRESQLPQCRGRRGGDAGGAGLQLVVHHDGADSDGMPVDVAAAGEVGGDGGKRERVGPAAAGHEDPRGVAGVGEGVLQHFPRLADDGREPAGPASSAGNRRLARLGGGRHAD